MKVVIAGASGFIGSGLERHLSREGHDVRTLIRRRRSAKPDPAYWDPASGHLDPPIFDGVDAAVCLSGRSIAGRRWSAKVKRDILESRVNSLRLISDCIAKLEEGPRTLICASAVGYYGDRGEEIVDESSGQGNGFLAHVCREWEDSAKRAVQAGVRVVFLRFGLVLDPGGGALRTMRLPFRLGMGGRLGSGAQYVSWATLPDVVRIAAFALQNASLAGPVNAVSPQPVNNRDFTRTLARTLSRPAFLPVPAFLIRTLLGEMGRELLLSSTRAVPTALLNAGYEFEHPDLEAGLREVLGR